MVTPHRPTFPTRVENLAVMLTDDGSRTLLRLDTNDAYHSGSGALAETRHVYFSNSGAGSRLSAGQPTSILEIGLGTGMGMLLTIDAASRSSTELRYVSFENQWLPADVLRELKPHEWISQRDLVDRYLEYRESLPEHVGEGTFRWQVNEKQLVTIHHTDVRSHQFDTNERFDAVYFDPFAPASDPQLWQHELLAKIYDVMADNGRLATYCVSRQVRETLTQIGFDVLRASGPTGGKREVMIATKRATEAATAEYAD